MEHSYGLGHELQHAVEIADAREVTDNDTVAKLYRRIGHELEPCQGRRRFDTAAAREIGDRVLLELKSADRRPVSGEKTAENGSVASRHRAALASHRSPAAGRP
jgi:hypothetical protein